MNSKISIIWSVNKNELTKIVQTCTTMGDILKHLGISKSGSTYRMLHSRLKKDNIDYTHINLKHNNSIGIQPALNYETVLTENSKYDRTTARRIISRNNLITKICKCGLSNIWQGKPLTLVLDHKNGKRNDHRIENLQYLCPNCNSQTETFGSRNFKNQAPVV